MKNYILSTIVFIVILAIFLSAYTKNKATTDIYNAPVVHETPVASFSPDVIYPSDGKE